MSRVEARLEEPRPKGRRFAVVAVMVGVLASALTVAMIAATEDSSARPRVAAAADAVVPPNLAYARLRGDGRLDVSRSRGIDQSMVRYVKGTFCFYLPFQPLHVMAMVGEDNNLGSTAQASITTNDPDCPGVETAHVQMVRKNYPFLGPAWFETYRVPKGALYVVFLRPPLRGRIGTTPYVYGRVDHGGRVDAARSSGITDSMITLRPGVIGKPWTYCFNFPFTPKFVFITPEHPIPPRDGGTRLYPVIPQYTTSGGSSICPGEEVAHLEFMDYYMSNNRENVDPLLTLQLKSWRPYAFNVFATTMDIPGYASGNVTSFGTLASGNGIANSAVYKVSNNTGLYCLDAPFPAKSALAMHEGQDNRVGRWQSVAQVGTVRGEFTGAGSTDRTGCNGSDHIQMVIGQRKPSLQLVRQDAGAWTDVNKFSNGAFSFLLIP